MEMYSIHSGNHPGQFIIKYDGVIIATVTGMSSGQVALSAVENFNSNFVEDGWLGRLMRYMRIKG